MLFLKKKKVQQKLKSEMFFWKSDVKERTFFYAYIEFFNTLEELTLRISEKGVVVFSVQKKRNEFQMMKSDALKFSISW